MDWMSLIKDFLPLIISAVVFLCSLFVTKSVKKSIKGVGEVMKFRMPDYKSSDTEKLQSFSNKAVAYDLDERENVLVQRDELVDLVKQIASVCDTSFERALQKYFGDPPSYTDGISEAYYGYKEDLEFLNEASQMCEEYRERFGLPLEMSHSDIIARIQSESDKLKSKIGGLNKDVASISDKSSSQSETVQPNGEKVASKESL